MSVYSYRYQRRKFFYFKIRVNGKQYSRRIDAKGDRYITRTDAMLAESHFINGFAKKEKRNRVYIYSIFDDFVNYLNSRYKATTVNHIVGSFKVHIFPLIKDLNVKDVNEDTVKLLNEIISNLGNISKNHVISAAKNLLRFLSAYGVNIRPDSIQGGRRFDISNSKIVNFWTLDEFNKFISVVDDSFYKLLFNVLYYYGLRISELRGIRKECFTPNFLTINQCITNRTMIPGQVVVSPKTKCSNRSFPMLPFIYDLFLKIPKNNSKYVFSSFKDSLVVGESSIRWRLDHYCLKAGVKKIKLHEFRHSCASLLINEGKDELQVAYWLGHSNPSITKSIYSHLYKNRKNEVFEFLNDCGTKKNT